MPGHQEFTALSSEEVEQAATHVADMQEMGGARRI